MYLKKYVHFVLPNFPLAARKVVLNTYSTCFHAEVLGCSFTRKPYMYVCMYVCTLLFTYAYTMRHLILYVGVVYISLKYGAGSILL